jgi:hypothetical protein
MPMGLALIAFNRTAALAKIEPPRPLSDLRRFKANADDRIP